MNYYEELGIRQDAALEEIRQAYKVLARLLHPDSQPDARLKAMAECQMKRLNEILAVLTDSQKRRQYDESLSGSPKVVMEWAPPPPPVRPAYGYQLLHFGLRHWFWILIGLVVVGVGLWCVQQSNSAVSQVTPIPGGPATDKPAGGEAPQQPTGKAVIRTAPHGASAAASRGGTRRPVTSAATASRIAPTGVDTTARPQAIACRSVSDCVSERLMMT